MNIENKEIEDISYLKFKNIISNKEMIELLKQFPEDANICIEYCNPKSLTYESRIIELEE